MGVGDCLAAKLIATAARASSFWRAPVRGILAQAARGDRSSAAWYLLIASKLSREPRLDSNGVHYSRGHAHGGTCWSTGRNGARTLRTRYSSRGNLLDHHRTRGAVRILG